MVTEKPQSPAMEFLVDSLKKDSNAIYANLKAKADEKKLKIFPVMFGRAKLLLGLVKAAKRGTGKVAKANAAKKAVTAGLPAAGASKSEQVRALLSTGMSVADIAKKVGCTPNLVYVIKSKGGTSSKRSPGRPRTTTTTTTNGLDGILNAVKNSERERVQMRTALERIQSILSSALA